MIGICISIGAIARHLIERTSVGGETSAYHIIIGKACSTIKKTGVDDCTVGIEEQSVVSLVIEVPPLACNYGIIEQQCTGVGVRCIEIIAGNCISICFQRALIQVYQSAIRSCSYT